VAGLTTGKYSVSLRAFSRDGSAQPEVIIAGVTGTHSVSSFNVQFSPTPGAIPKSARTATFLTTREDIKNSAQLNLISRELAKALLQIVDVAASTAAEGHTRTSKTISKVFRDLVERLTPRHIDAIAAQVLIEDADSLLSR
jgi:hypothetical protein